MTALFGFIIFLLFIYLGWRGYNFILCKRNPSRVNQAKDHPNALWFIGAICVLSIIAPSGEMKTPETKIASKQSTPANNNSQDRDKEKTSGEQRTSSEQEKAALAALAAKKAKDKKTAEKKRLAVAAQKRKAKNRAKARAKNKARAVTKRKAANRAKARKQSQVRAAAKRRDEQSAHAPKKFSTDRASKYAGMNCSDIPESDFPTPPGDPEGWDRDGDGVSCETS